MWNTDLSRSFVFGTYGYKLGHDFNGIDAIQLLTNLTQRCFQATSTKLRSWKTKSKTSHHNGLMTNLITHNSSLMTHPPLSVIILFLQFD